MSYAIDTAASGKEGEHPNEEAKLAAAFGPKWRDNVDQIKTTVKDMRTQRLKIHDANPHTYDEEAGGKGKVSTTIE
jgi:hypothetical protein